MSLEEKLNLMKEEIAAEFGILNYSQLDKGELSARTNGKIGGEMVKRLVELGKKQLVMEKTKDLIPVQSIEIKEIDISELNIPEYIVENYKNEYQYQ